MSFNVNVIYILCLLLISASLHEVAKSIRELPKSSTKENLSFKEIDTTVQEKELEKTK